MQTDFYAPASQLAVRELLFVGFENNFKAGINDSPYQEQAYHVDHVNHPGQAMAWLEECIEGPYRPPFAVVFDLEWLQQHGYDLPKRLSEHPQLRLIPAIALAGRRQIIPAAELLENGIDDGYAMPIPWEKLVSRIEFLQRYKVKLLRFGDKPAESISAFQIPLHKRVFDVFAASVGILLTAPLWLLVALAIKLESRGPVLYHSRRVGAGYKVFDFIKFRSMYYQADTQLDEYRHLNQYDPGSVFVKLDGDPRVTRVGRFIRTYSIDELPQLINILRGDMSLVGNRPLPLYEAEQLVTDQWCPRFLAPAGLTGKWQVARSKKTDMTSEDRIRLDVAYASERSMMKDMGILLKTFLAIKQRGNA